ncbi:N-acetylmuramoyl-L-alanine amidase, family 3 [Mameliella alba]|uniref:N-acetylmuramoyl-L-alanine amidase, family 3 n=1 Tax=Mameliella alba TaxID=561184 RepID=A0A0B3RW42_9RHOB|nr:N-acetylmuramoyl-L-alanine amidase, family 3 [Mameliella alba]
MIRSLLAVLATTCLLASPAASDYENIFPTDSFGDTVLPLPLWMQGDRGEGYLPFGMPEIEEVARFGKTSMIAQTGRPVGRLDVSTGTGVLSCTGFLVTVDLLLTTALCAQGTPRPTGKAAEIESIRFTLGYLDKTDPENAEAFEVDTTPVEIDEALNYAVLRITSGQPGERYGTLALTHSAPLDHQPLRLYGHPLGFPQNVAYEDCWVATPAILDGDLRHTCDTLPGNEGSPLVHTLENRAIGLHLGGFGNSVEHAIPIGRILDSSRVLKPAVQD